MLPWKIIITAGVVLGVGALAFSLGKQSHTSLPQAVRGIFTGTANTGKNPLAGKKLYVDPNSNASRQAATWRNERPADARAMDKLAALPGAQWVGNEGDIPKLSGYIQAAKAKQEIPVTVAYNIPGRDCGQYSAGGAESAQHYKEFIDKYARAIGTADAIVILEPDALVQVNSDSHAGGTCLSSEAQHMRYELLNYAVDTFQKLPAAVVYIDAGNSAWIVDHSEVTGRLKAAGVKNADGFSLNVSNFRTLDETIPYGEKISEELGGSHFVIDTSRNGAGPFENKAQPDFNWCNPPGRALGNAPTVDTDQPLVDAYLYIKNVGESDGTDNDHNKCFGGPKAGTWAPEYALGLIKRWPENLQ